MKIRILIVYLLAGLATFAQNKCVTKKQGTETITECFHQNGKLSTRKSDRSDKNGTVTGYDQKGDQIFTFQTRHFAGHASVYLQYHPNGQVKKVEFSEAPDAGIQWYRLTIWIDENGKELSRFQDSYEDLVRPGNMF